MEDLERRIDPAVEDALLSDWLGFWEGRCREPYFSPSRPGASPPGLGWPAVGVNEALEDNDRMLLHQATFVSRALAEASGNILCVRCNYGVGTLPSLFGAEQFLMDPELNCLPNVRPLPGGAEDIRRLLDAGVPDLDGGLGGRVFAMAEHYRRVLADYPNVRRYVYLYHPDLQGPMDVCELLWGSGIFLDLYEQPELVHDAMALICETYERFMARWEAVAPPAEAYPAGYSAHWRTVWKGRIVLREDSAMNLSPEMFHEFIRPYDQRLLDNLGGGGIHYCGRGDHWIGDAAEMDGVYAFHASQPEYNDMEVVFASTIDRDLRLVDLPRRAADEALAAGRDLRGRVHVRQ
jgi:hypothetical protein